MILPLTNLPFSPNFSSNVASNNRATNVGGIGNSGEPGDNSGGPGAVAAAVILEVVEVDEVETCSSYSIQPKIRDVLVRTSY